MATISSHIRALRLALIVALAACAALGQTCVPQAAGQRALGARASGSFGYPVKPFHQEHPVRGFFGDPRTVFTGPPTRETLMHGGGTFNFHEGVDISAPNGTAVYPVASGSVVAAEKREDWHVQVDTGDGVRFDYWHIKPAVRVGGHVTAYETVLGHIVRPAAHVHLTVEIGGRPVNPLAPGRLAPYTDTTSPHLDSISIDALDMPGGCLANFVRGRVEMQAGVSDLPTVPALGIWRDMPTTPALVTWRVQFWTGKVVVPERIALDFRSTIPAPAAFWAVYARGTFQNMAVFGQHYSYLQHGAYHVRLSARPFDTRTLRDGVYDLIVTAKDSRGGSASRTQRFTVHNRSGWVGS